MILVIPKPDAAEESSSQPAYPIPPLCPPPLLDLGLSRSGVANAITPGEAVGLATCADSGNEESCDAHVQDTADAAMM